MTLAWFLAGVALGALAAALFYYRQLARAEAVRLRLKPPPPRSPKPFNRFPTRRYAPVKPRFWRRRAQRSILYARKSPEISRSSKPPSPAWSAP